MVVEVSAASDSASLRSTLKKLSAFLISIEDNTGKGKLALLFMLLFLLLIFSSFRLLLLSLLLLLLLLLFILIILMFIPPPVEEATEDAAAAAAAFVTEDKTEAEVAAFDSGPGVGDGTKGNVGL